MTQSTQCLFCEHFHLDFKCDAFPERIPREIFDGEFDHTKPYPGDNGIQFEAIPGFEPDEEEVDEQKSVMAPSALDRLPYLKFD